MMDQEVESLSRLLVIATIKYNEQLRLHDAVIESLRLGRKAIASLLQVSIDHSDAAPSVMYQKIIAINDSMHGDSKIPQHIIDDLVVKDR